MPNGYGASPGPLPKSHGASPGPLPNGYRASPGPRPKSRGAMHGRKRIPGVRKRNEHFQRVKSCVRDVVECSFRSALQHSHSRQEKPPTGRLPRPKRKTIFWTSLYSSIVPRKNAASSPQGLGPTPSYCGFFTRPFAQAASNSFLSMLPSLPASACAKFTM